jgi:hypothetical protein
MMFWKFAGDQKFGAVNAKNTTTTASAIRTGAGPRLPVRTLSQIRRCSGSSGGRVSI